ncbi:MAG: hypothetical protein E6230_24880 [Paenibacillus dendritiformis]|uniref:hypothetical protein n=1 Tax=uncultured Paenibacillus sp. TaxID=227322 RepID=UPI0025E6E21C|nr:hypothetical protein [uncultured Paenibacillus sp.]MDU5145415.1 hypothetical protein [Paenibacillus dendritiformis]
MNLQSKVFILRQYERYCYQISLFITQDEQQSIKVAQSALLELATDPLFFEVSQHEQLVRVRKESMRSSLRWYSENLSKERLTKQPT